jgi:hypothetical protein
VQYHPELKSRPNRPSPPLFAFAAAACGLYEQLGQAGDMWRSYDEGTKKEISWLYSPSSGLKQRPFSEPSPAAARSGVATAVGSPDAAGAGAGETAGGGVKRSASSVGEEAEEGTGGYKLKKLDSISRYEQH